MFCRAKNDLVQAPSVWNSFSLQVTIKANLLAELENTAMTVIIILSYVPIGLECEVVYVVVGIGIAMEK